MTCAEFTGMLAAYLDGETTPDERTVMERHAASCALCARRLQSHRALKHTLARLEGQATPPDAVRAHIETLRFQRPQRRRPLRRLIFAIATAVVLGAIVFSGVWLVQERRSSLNAELISDHLRYAPELMPAEIASGDLLTVSRFFAGKLSFTPIVPALAGARIMGGRICRIEGRKAQLLFYEAGDTRLSLYVMDRPAAITGCQSSGSHHLCGHRHGALSLVLVGDAPREQLRSLLDSAAL